MAIIKGLHAKLIAQDIGRVMEEKDYAFFGNGIFNVNIVWNKIFGRKGQ